MRRKERSFFTPISIFATFWPQNNLAELSKHQVVANVSKINLKDNATRQDLPAKYVMPQHFLQYQQWVLHYSYCAISGWLFSSTLVTWTLWTVGEMSLLLPFPSLQAPQYSTKAVTFEGLCRFVPNLTCADRRHRRRRGALHPHLCCREILTWHSRKFILIFLEIFNCDNKRVFFFKIALAMSRTPVSFVVWNNDSIWHLKTNDQWSN